MNSTANTVNAIEAAVLPLKKDAIERAKQYAAEVAAKIAAELAQHGLDVCAPYPQAWKAPTATTDQYRAAKRKYDLYRSLQTEKGRAAFIQAAQDNAAAQYDMFVAKLNSKIGPVVLATLEGNHVWSHSFLTVETAAGELQIWKTQTIINVSKLGTVFNQFPTRKVKAAK